MITQHIYLEIRFIKWLNLYKLNLLIQ